MAAVETQGGRNGDTSQIRILPVARYFLPDIYDVLKLLLSLLILHSNNVENHMKTPNEASEKIISNPLFRKGYVSGAATLCLGVMGGYASIVTCATCSLRQ